MKEGIYVFDLRTNYVANGESGIHLGFDVFSIGPNFAKLENRILKKRAPTLDLLANYLHSAQMTNIHTGNMPEGWEYYDLEQQYINMENQSRIREVLTKEDRDYLTEQRITINLTDLSPKHL